VKDASGQPEAAPAPKLASDDKAGWAAGAARADAEGARGAKGGRGGQGPRAGASEMGAGGDKDKDKDRGVARRLMAPAVADKKKAGHDVEGVTCGGVGGAGVGGHAPAAPQRSKSTEPTQLAKDQPRGLSPVPPR